MDHATPHNSKKEAVGVIYRDRLLGRVELSGSVLAGSVIGMARVRRGVTLETALCLDLFCPASALLSPLMLCIHQAEQVEGLALRRGAQAGDVHLGRESHKLIWPIVD